MIKKRIRRKQPQNDLNETTAYWKFKDEALDCSLWRIGFGKGNGPVVRQNR
jgi:hypothetical protein